MCPFIRNLKPAMKRTFFPTALLLAAILPLSAQETEIPKDNARTIRIDPETANGGSMDQVFSEIEYIPLETTKESLFGDISKMEVTDDAFVILDRDTKCILTFDKKGKYRSKIALGKYVGPGVDMETLYPRFTLEKNGTDYTIRVSMADLAHTFDRDSRLLEDPRKINMKREPSATHRFSDSLRAIYHFRSDEGHYRYAFLDEENRVVAKYFEIDTTDMSGDFGVGGPGFTPTDDPEVFHAVRYYDYNIYRVDKNGLSVAYTLVFPEKRTIPADFNTNKIYHGKQIDYFFRNHEKIFGIGHVYKIGDFLYVKCGSLNAEIRKNGSFVYDLEHDYLISLNRLDPDELSHHLPIIGDWHNDFKQYDGTYLYASLSSREMFEHYAEIKKNHPVFPPEMQRYFEKGSKNDNPVIIRLKPKKTMM